MVSALEFEKSASELINRSLYQAFQGGKALFGLVHKGFSSRMAACAVPGFENATVPLSEPLQKLLETKRDELLDEDWRDAQQGIYPERLLFDNPWRDFFQYYPAVWTDMPSIWARLRQKEYKAFAESIDRTGYPAYYLQNFHFQTDGYLSELSANLYDLQVELLFNGTADPMRRRILAPLKQHLTAAPFDSIPQPKVLDVACGTGRTLRMLRGTLPNAKLFGTDLSPAYLRKANESLSELPGELPQLMQANAEALPYLDNFFDAVTSVFLFHELPASARQAVIEQAFRVVKPGGLFIICDSLQLMDTPAFKDIMLNFTASFHEPYYRHYIKDDLNARLGSAGFEKPHTAQHFFSKYWVARKPAKV
ncbi:MAG: class I SAM-dependent methyltransferase [Cyanobacteria bacterium P01_H01_bin.15]